MKHKVKIQAIGDNASGKSFLLEKIRDFLIKEEFKVNDESLKENHEIIVLNEH